MLKVADRPEQDRETLRRAILDAARDLFLKEGYQNVSMRKIADRIQYSPAALYGYFSGKEDIVLALAEEGFRLLAGSRLQSDTDDPLADLRRLFMSYYDFSKSHSEYFALMFVERSIAKLSHDWGRSTFIRDLSREGPRLVRRCIDAAIFPPTTRPELAIGILWAAVHGPAVIRLCDRVPRPEDADRLAAAVLDATLTGLAARRASAIPSPEPTEPAEPTVSELS